MFLNFMKKFLLKTKLMFGYLPCQHDWTYNMNDEECDIPLNYVKYKIYKTCGICYKKKTLKTFRLFGTYRHISNRVRSECFYKQYKDNKL